jgi:ectoine hydroxylase-related dioxygenase (phytanoyl-CoA dioxygenase family)
VESGPYIEFPKGKSAEEWLKVQDGYKTGEWKEKFLNDGYLVVEELISEQEVQVYLDLYNKFVSREIDAGAHRHDLGSNEPQKLPSDENVCQIMWPSDYVRIGHGPLHQRSKAISKFILGDDIEFDFDMLIYKAPHTNTDVPWHQDEGYWPDMPDKRAISCWVALDNATVENGCMWFVPGSHKLPLHKHDSAAPGSHVLVAKEVNSSLGVAAPLKPGGCTFHSGKTLHFTRGNSTDTKRRAYIVNHRPASMVEWERTNGFSHGRESLSGIDHGKVKAISEKHNNT